MDAAAAALRISAHKSHKTSPWDDDLVERLKLLWADGVSASAIALEFGRGITRNAIIGKVHRLGFTNRVERRANSMPRPARPQKFKPLRREFSDWKPFIAPAISDLDIPLGQRKSFMELAPGDCRWGVGDVGSPGFFGEHTKSVLTVYAVAGKAPNAVPAGGLQPVSNVVRETFHIG